MFFILGVFSLKYCTYAGPCDPRRYNEPIVGIPSTVGPIRTEISRLQYTPGNAKENKTKGEWKQKNKGEFSPKPAEEPLAIKESQIQ